MSRLSEIENEIDRLLAAQSDWTPLARTLAAEVDELRGKLDALRAEADPQALVICHMQGRAEGDEVITKLLAMLRPKGEPMKYMLGDQKVDHDPAARVYARALEIAGRTE